MGQLFCDGSARQIVAMLMEECAKGAVRIALGQPVRDVTHADGLFSVTGFTSTQAYPAATQTVTIPNQGGELGDANIPNLIGATSPFTYIVR